MTTLDLFSFANIPAVSVNWIAVIVAAIVAMAIGYVWYGPLFGKQWLVLVGLTEEKAKKAASSAMVMAFVAALITALVLAHVVDWVGAGDVVSGATAGIIVWLGFSATMLAMNYAFAQKPMNLFWIDATNQLVTLVVMGAVLAVWA